MIKHQRHAAIDAEEPVVEQAGDKLLSKGVDVLANKKARESLEPRRTESETKSNTDTRKLRRAANSTNDDRATV